MSSTTYPLVKVFTLQVRNPYSKSPWGAIFDTIKPEKIKEFMDHPNYANTPGEPRRTRYVTRLFRSNRLPANLA